MLIKYERLKRRQVAISDRDGIFRFALRWPRKLEPGDLLQAVCGPAEPDGLYVFHEPPLKLMELTERLRATRKIGMLALMDLAEVGPGESLSLAASGTIAVTFIEGLDVPRRDAVTITRMNLEDRLHVGAA